jgi:hypothetical protein
MNNQIAVQTVIMLFVVIRRQRCERIMQAVHDRNMMVRQFNNIVGE